jgi:hypothetical protein
LEQSYIADNRIILVLFSLSLSSILFNTAPIEHQVAFTSMAAAVRSVEKWQELGHQLNISPEMLSNLFNSSRSGAECRDEMIAYWEKHDNDASWEKLARALTRMGEIKLAEGIIKEQRVEGRGRAIVTRATPTQNNPTTALANAEASDSTFTVVSITCTYKLLRVLHGWVTVPIIQQDTCYMYNNIYNWTAGCIIGHPIDQSLYAIRPVTCMQLGRDLAIDPNM